jgi:hypothetical protein
MALFSLVVLLGMVGGVVALADGILRLRASRASSVLAIIELIVAALFLVSLFLPFVPWSWLVLGSALVAVLVIALVTSGRRGLTIPIVALVLVAVYLLLWTGVLVVPGLN